MGARAGLAPLLAVTECAGVEPHELASQAPAAPYSKCHCVASPEGSTDPLRIASLLCTPDGRSATTTGGPKIPALP